MTVLKAHAADDVRRFSRPVVGEPAQAERAAPVDTHIAELSAALAASEAAFAAYREQSAASIQTARNEGAAAARRDDDRRFALLEQRVADAAAAWQDRLDGLERLAAQLAEAALAKLFDDHGDFGDMVARTLARRVAAIGAAAAVRIRVSVRDFADGDALVALAGRAGLPADAIVAAPDAPAGACEIDLAMGHLDLSIAGQWRAIGQALAEIATEDAP